MEVHQLEDPVLQIKHPQLLPYALTVAFQELPHLLILAHLEVPHCTTALQYAPMGLPHLLEPPPVICLNAGKVQMRTDELVPCVLQVLRGHYYYITRPRLGREGRTHAKGCCLVKRLIFIRLRTRRLVERLLHALYLVIGGQRPLIQEGLQLFSQQPADMLYGAQLISHRVDEAPVVYQQAI